MSDLGNEYRVAIGERSAWATADVHARHALSLEALRAEIAKGYDQADRRCEALQERVFSEWQTQGRVLGWQRERIAFWAVLGLLVALLVLEAAGVWR